MLLGTLGARLSGNLLSGKGAIAKKLGRGILRAEYEAKRADYGLKKKNSDSTSSINKFWNSKILWKWTKI